MPFQIEYLHPTVREMQRHLVLDTQLWAKDLDVADLFGQVGIALPIEAADLLKPRRLVFGDRPGRELVPPGDRGHKDGVPKKMLGVIVGVDDPIDAVSAHPGQAGLPLSSLGWHHRRIHQQPAALGDDEPDIDTIVSRVEVDPVCKLLEHLASCTNSLAIPHP